MANMSTARVKNRFRRVSASRRSSAAAMAVRCSFSWSSRICSACALTCSVFLYRSTKTATFERRISGTTGVLMKSTAPRE